LAFVVCGLGFSRNDFKPYTANHKQKKENRPPGVLISKHNKNR
jgi:hypothetical protein